MSDGSQRARELLETSGARLHTLLVRITLRHDAADDLLQELFLKLSQSRGFANARIPEAYAHRVAVRMAFDWRRARQRRATAGLAEHDPPDRSPSPLSGIARQEELEAVLATMEKLSDEAQQILTMRFLEGQSYDAIAAELGRTPHRARSACHKAIVRLRRMLAKRGAMQIVGNSSDV